MFNINEIKLTGVSNIVIPKFSLVKQDIFDDELSESKIEEMIHTEITNSKLSCNINKGDEVAVCVGSRGIDKLDIVVKNVIKEIKSLKACPFIVPAMGSHGGATSLGQTKILKKYGIEENKVNAPIKASMEVVKLGISPSGVPIYIDSIAFDSDAIIVINRIKEHTRFTGEHESGILKMLAIGLGKHEGATTIHREGYSKFKKLIPEVGKEIIERAPIKMGIGLLENGKHNLFKIKAMEPEKIALEEKKMLEEMKKNKAKIPFDEVDVLIVDEIGKDISGAGMDTNIVGRAKHVNVDVKIKTIIVRDLTESTDGNANGMGLADITTKKLFNKIDFNPTYTNSLTTNNFNNAKVPMVLENDKVVLLAAIKASNKQGDKVKIVRIKNTLSLETMWVSQGLLEEVKKNADLYLESELFDMNFGKNDFIVE